MKVYAWLIDWFNPPSEKLPHGDDFRVGPKSDRTPRDKTVLKAENCVVIFFPTARGTKPGPHRTCGPITVNSLRRTSPSNNPRGNHPTVNFSFFILKKIKIFIWEFFFIFLGRRSDRIGSGLLPENAFQNFRRRPAVAERANGAPFDLPHHLFLPERLHSANYGVQNGDQRHLQRPGLGQGCHGGPNGNSFPAGRCGHVQNGAVWWS